MIFFTEHITTPALTEEQHKLCDCQEFNDQNWNKNSQFQQNE